MDAEASSEPAAFVDEPLAIVAATPEDVANELPDSASELRCESCGAPVDEAGLCTTCERIFRKVLQPKPAPPVAAMAPAYVPAPIPSPLAPPPLPPVVTEPKPAPRRVAPPPPKPAAPVRSSWHLGWLGAIAVVGIAAALVVAVAVPLSQQWLERQWGGPALTTDPSGASPAPEGQGTSDSPTAPAAVPPGGPAHSVAPARAETSKSKPPKTTPTSRNNQSRGSANRGAQTKVPSNDVAVPPPPPAPTPLVAESVAPPAPVAAAPPPEPVVVPVGQVFERAQVNEPPRVESQVEPHVPETLQGQALDDVVVLRVLVSHTGRPATVNVLRRSKAGSSLDEAVVAAVKRWTFSPAQRRGQAVNCWFNVGVPVKRVG